MRVQTLKGSYPHQEDPVCESSVGRWCSSWCCCAERQNCPRAAKWASATQEKYDRVERIYI